MDLSGKNGFKTPLHSYVFTEDNGYEEVELKLPDKEWGEALQDAGYNSYHVEAEVRRLGSEGIPIAAITHFRENGGQQRLNERNPPEAIVTFWLYRKKLSCVVTCPSITDLISHLKQLHHLKDVGHVEFYVDSREKRERPRKRGRPDGSRPD